MGRWGETPTKSNVARANDKECDRFFPRGGIGSGCCHCCQLSLRAAVPLCFISLLFNELILTISFSSLTFVAISVVPMLTLVYSLFLGQVESVSFGYYGNLIVLKMPHGDTAVLRMVLRYRLLVVAITFIVLASGSLLMVGQIPQEILPASTQDKLTFCPVFSRYSSETNRRVMSAVDDILLKQPETDYIFTSGWFLFGNNTSENPLRASSNITLKPGSDVEAYVERVSNEFNKLNLVETILRLSPGQVRGLI